MGKALLALWGAVPRTGDEQSPGAGGGGGASHGNRPARVLSTGKECREGQPDGGIVSGIDLTLAGHGRHLESGRACMRSVGSFKTSILLATTVVGGVPVGLLGQQPEHQWLVGFSIGQTM